MKNVNSVFSQYHEELYTVKFHLGDKEFQRQIGIKMLERSIFAGHITRNKTVSARWVWDVRRYDNPVFYTITNGSKDKFAKTNTFVTTMMNEQIREFVKAAVDEKAPGYIDGIIRARKERQMAAKKPQPPKQPETEPPVSC